MVYVLILIHCIILMVGGHYTYAEVPLFDYLGEFFGSSRNNYDKVGHFAQGFDSERNYSKEARSAGKNVAIHICGFILPCI